MFELSLSRIYSQVYKNAKLLTSSPFRWADVIVWPFILLFSITFFIQFSGADPRFMAVVILGMIGWRAVYFFQMDIVTTFMDEYWIKSLPHLFLSPLRTWELVIGGSISGFVKFVFVMLVYLLLSGLIYSFYVPNLATFAIALFFLGLFGISIGMISLGLTYLYKEDAFSLAFIIPDLTVLMTGVYFDVNTVLPQPLLTIVQFIPSTHAFNLLKSMVGFGAVDYPALIATCILWLVIGAAFNNWAFNRARKNGKLAKLG